MNNSGNYTTVRVTTTIFYNDTNFVDSNTVVIASAATAKATTTAATTSTAPARAHVFYFSDRVHRR